MKKQIPNLLSFTILFFICLLSSASYAQIPEKEITPNSPDIERLIADRSFYQEKSGHSTQPIIPLSSPLVSFKRNMPCDSNYSCDKAFEIPIMNYQTTTVIGCNFGMPAANFSNCDGQFLNPIAWFKFKYSSVNEVTFNIESTDLAKPVYVIMNSCNTIVACNPETFITDLNQEYFIGIADSSGLTGSFVLSLIAEDNNSLCMTNEDFKVIGTSFGSPIEGPYKPGEELTLKYTVNFFSGGNCQWIHSFIPYFSECFTNYSNGEEPTIVEYPFSTNSGNLGWVPSGTIHWKPIAYNNDNIGINVLNGKICNLGTLNCEPFSLGDGICGSETGTPMPAGWVVKTPSGTCGGSTEPNMSWGIPQGCNNNTQQQITYKITIPSDTLGCGLTSGSEAFVVGIAAFADGHTGGWFDPFCNGNRLLTLPLDVDLCPMPSFSLKDTVLCFDGNLETDFDLIPQTAKLDWKVNNPNLNIGATDGTDTIFSQNYHNKTDAIQTITYTIKGIDADTCSGIASHLNVIIYPETIHLDAGSDQEICQGDKLFDLSSSNVEYTWSTSGDGTFPNQPELSFYIPGEQDLLNKTFQLIATPVIPDEISDCFVIVPDTITYTIGNCFCSHPDLEALLILYNSTNGSNWKNNSGWKEGNARLDCDVCNWPGVTCDINNRVKVLNLLNNGLDGALPEFDLPFLELLELSSNNLTAFPAKLEFPNLYSIYLSNNNFTNSIPSLINCTRLLEFTAYRSNIPGPIPEYGDKLKVLSVANNNLSGCFSEKICLLNTFNGLGNPLLPWEGDRTYYCEGVNQIGAPCVLGNGTEPSHINSDCVCVEGTISSKPTDFLNRLSVFPNPNDGRFNISTTIELSKLRVGVTNMVGQNINYILEGTHIVVDDAVSGVYFISFTEKDSGSTKTLKLVVVK